MENPKVNLNKNKFLAIGITLCAIIVLGGIAFTFFAVGVSNTNNEKFSTTTATLALIFDDNDNGVSGTLGLGDTITKKFTIQNTGTEDAYGKINWVDLVNTYRKESLSWTLESSTSNNGTYTLIGNGRVPTSSSPTTALLNDYILVPSGQTLYYKLTIKLVNLDVLQNDDITARLNSKFNLQSGNIPPKGTEVITNLANGANQNSTDVIDIAEYRYLDKYVFNFNGAINTSSDAYNNLTTCELDVSDFLEFFGSNITASCQLNNSTGKYDLLAYGHSSTDNTIYDDQLDCQDNLQAYGANNVTCVQDEVPRPLDIACQNFLAYDGTADNNLRYVGKNPCNYVLFNDEPITYKPEWAIKLTDMNHRHAVEVDPVSSEEECKQMIGSNSRFECVKRYVVSGGWRIIGVMNNIDDGTGKKETRLKLVKVNPLKSGNDTDNYGGAGGYAWDYSHSKNDWSTSDLKNELNGDYLNTSLSSNTTWYNNVTFKYGSVLKANSQAMIGNAKWNLGGVPNPGSSTIYTPGDFYSLERGTTVYSGNATSWTGKIALIYASDYGLATSGGVVANRSTCLNNLSMMKTSARIYDWSNYDCRDGDWLTPHEYYLYEFDTTWTLTSNSNSNSVSVVDGLNDICNDNITYGWNTKPAFYLKSDVKIISGDGSPENPFILSE